MKRSYPSPLFPFLQPLLFSDSFYLDETVQWKFALEGKDMGQNIWPWVSVLCCSEREAGQAQEGLGEHTEAVGENEAQKDLRKAVSQQKSH